MPLILEARQSSSHQRAQRITIIFSSIASFQGMCIIERNNETEANPESSRPGTDAALTSNVLLVPHGGVAGAETHYATNLVRWRSGPPRFQVRLSPDGSAP